MEESRVNNIKTKIVSIEKLIIKIQKMKTIKRLNIMIKKQIKKKNKKLIKMYLQMKNLKIYYMILIMEKTKKEINNFILDNLIIIIKLQNNSLKKTKMMNI